MDTKKITPDYIAMPIAKLLQEHPYLEDFFTSLNLPVTDGQYSLKEILDRMNYLDFQNCGMAKEEMIVYFHKLLQRMQRLSRREPMRVSSITVFGGRDKDGAPEELQLKLRQGQVVAIVGPTGSGKSRFLEDIEFLAQGDTPTSRVVHLNGTVPEDALRFTAENSLVAQLSQNMNFVMDLPAREFIRMHAESRFVPQPERVVEEILHCANQLSGEAFPADISLTQLSGGQSRSLMIADVALLSASPIILIDEIENAGVDRRQALQLLVKKDKIVLVSTHDPLLALLADSRLVIKNGGVRQVLTTTQEEKACLEELLVMDAHIGALRQDLRDGQALSPPQD